MRFNHVRRSCDAPRRLPLGPCHSLIFLICLLAGVSASVCRAQETTKYWIFFRDKARQHVSSETVITERALQRRLQRGSTDHSWLDRPLTTSYLDALRRLGIETIVRSRWLNAVSAYVAQSQLELLSELEFVLRVEPVAVSERGLASTAVAGPSSSLPFVNPVSESKPAVHPSYGLDYGLSEKQLANINAIETLERGINGAGVRLGFLDTPYHQFQHEVFEHLTESARVIDVRDFVGKPQNSTHGLSVASVAVGFMEGELIGPAYGAEIVAAITEYAPSETNQEEDFFVAGLEWLEAMGADVVNVSLGYTTFDEGQQSYRPSDLDGDTGITTRAADHAASLGVAVVVSAGNSACASPESCWYYIGTPADGDSVITVGAVRRDSSRASFSSFGPTADGRTKPDVSAPGSFVYVATPDTFAYSSGTSFASPLVAAIVCQMLQVNPTLSPMEVRHLLRQTASRADAPDDSVGWGIINAAAAVDQAQLVAAERSSSQDVNFSTQLFPNPATDEVLIHITGTVPGRIRLTVYDLLGRAVRAESHSVAAGSDTIRLSLRGLSPGLYLYAVASAEKRAAGKLIVR